jgi:hypothetical protein
MKHVIETAGKAALAAQKLKAEATASIVTAIVAAFGLVIALAWQDVIKSLVTVILAALNLTADADLLSKTIVAVIVTILSVVAILIISKAKKQ